MKILQQKTTPSLRDWSIFIGTPHDKYYIRKWLELEETGKYSFNIGAFFFGVSWMIYRKMYVESAFLLIFLFTEGIFEELLLEQLGFTNTTIFGYLSSIGIATIVGFVGNKIYLNHTNRKISAIKNENYTETTYQQVLKERGGTSILAVVIALSIFILFFVGFFMLLDIGV